MSIIFTIISYNKEKTLCDYTLHRGNFEHIAKNILHHINELPQGAIKYDIDYLFYYIHSSTNIYMCMCDSTFPIELAFDYLEDIKNSFDQNFSLEEIETAYAYSLNMKFRKILEEKTKSFNERSPEEGTDQIERFNRIDMGNQYNLIDSNELLGNNNEKTKLIVKRPSFDRRDKDGFYEGTLKIKERSRRHSIIKIIICFLFIFLLITGILMLYNEYGMEFLKLKLKLN